jgi:hypothetical protein
MGRTKDMKLNMDEQSFWDTMLNPITGWWDEPLTLNDGHYDETSLRQKQCEDDGGHEWQYFYTTDNVKCFNCGKSKLVHDKKKRK